MSQEPQTESRDLEEELAEKEEDKKGFLDMFKK